MITKARILIVDDTDEYRVSFSELVKSLEHDPYEAADGAQALEFVKTQFVPDIILLDIQMPEMDGYQVLEKLKADEVLKTIPVIMVTTIDNIESVIRCIQLGADDYITKPIQPEILKARISNSLVKLDYLKVKQEMLEKTLTGTIRMASDILLIVNPQIFGFASRVRKLAHLVADSMKIKDCWMIDLASIFIFTGCVTIPDDITERLFNGKSITANERKNYEESVLVSYRLIKNIPRLEKVAVIIKYCHKKINGAGVPEDEILHKTQIPDGSKILKVVMDYLELTITESNQTVIFDTMKTRSERYDQSIVENLKEVIIRESMQEVKEVMIKNLVQDMVFAEDVHTEKGDVKLASKWQEATMALIQRIQNVSQKMKIHEPVKVFIPKR